MSIAKPLEYGMTGMLYEITLEFWKESAHF